MGTRSFIARQTATGFEGVYCHWNGFLEHNGRILGEHYSEAEKLKRLVAGGALASLGPDIGSPHDFYDCQEGQTTYCHRDRGDDWQSVRPLRFKSYKTLLAYAYDRLCAYVYLFDGQAWQYAKYDSHLCDMSDSSPYSAFKPIPAGIEPA